MSDDRPYNVSRRTLIRAAAATAVAAAGAGLGAAPASAAPVSVPSGRAAGTGYDPAPFRDLDAKVREGMAKYAIPGVAIGVWHRGREYLRGFGVTSVDDPTPVDADTVFRIASTTKTFTGTVIMRLVEQGRIDLDRRVRSYLPDFRTADPAAAERVTVRQLLNHTGGWLGDYFEDTGQGADALARYVANMTKVPQLTPVGKVFSYNNAGFAVAGRVIEVVTGKPYEQAARELLVDPLGLTRSRFDYDEYAGLNVAAPHDFVDGAPVVQPAFYALPRAMNSMGGLISSARDQIRYARFHLGDGRVPGGGPRLLTRRSLRSMRSRPGPGGTLMVELDGVGVSWMLRPSAQGVRIVQHGGDLAGQHSGFLMVPDRDFAITVLTNSETGPALVDELVGDDWALRRFAGLSNLPAVPRALPPEKLAQYAGPYFLQQIGVDGVPTVEAGELIPDAGQLLITLGGQAVGRLAFYRHDYVLLLGPAGEPGNTRADFVRDGYGRVRFLRVGGRLFQRGPIPGGTTARRAPTAPRRLPRPFLS